VRSGLFNSTDGRKNVRVRSTRGFFPHPMRLSRHGIAVAQERAESVYATVKEKEWAGVLPLR